MTSSLDLDANCGYQIRLIRMHLFNKSLTILALTLIVIFLVGFVHSVAWSQSNDHWADPIILANANTLFTRPVIEADPWGNIHVFWADKFEGESPVPDEDLEDGDSIYHTFWDGNQWSEPIDIIIKETEAWAIVNPQVDTDREGNIYLLWSGQTGLYFSRNKAIQAHDASKWQEQELIVDDSFIDKPWMIVGSNGHIHVVYSQIRFNQIGSTKLAYIRSMDQGENWTFPLTLHEEGADVEVVPSNPRMVEDTRGWIHIVWDEQSPPDWIGQRVMYSRSEDGGNTWSSPEALAEIHEGESWAANPSLVATNDGDLHIVWVCGEMPSRCYQESTDGGQTWSSPQHIFGELHSKAGWDAMMGDLEGTLHLIVQLRYPRGIYYAFKLTGSDWSDPISIVSQSGFENGHYLQADLSGGNELHAVWQKSAQEGSPTYMMIMTSAPPIQLPAIPIVIETLVSTQTYIIPTDNPSLGNNLVQESNSSSSSFPFEPEMKPPKGLSTGQILLIGALSSITMTFLVAAIKRMRKNC